MYEMSFIVTLRFRSSSVELIHTDYIGSVGGVAPNVSAEQNIIDRQRGKQTGRQTDRQTDRQLGLTGRLDKIR